MTLTPTPTPTPLLTLYLPILVQLLWSWSDARGEHVPSHLFNGTRVGVRLCCTVETLRILAFVAAVVEAGGPQTLNWKQADSWIHAQPLRLP